MMGLRYLAHVKPSDESISHSQSAYTRTKNYDANKRRERYLRDRDAGKTGYKGVKARTTNPYGNYSNVYYNPQKAAEYYRKNKKSKNKGSNGTPSAVNGDLGGGSVQDKIKRLREASKFETDAQRKATKIKVENLRKTLQKKLEEKQKERASISERGERERQALQEKASSDREKARKSNTESFEKAKEDAKQAKDSEVGPYREENAKLRAQLDSMGKNSKNRAKLMRKLAQNNDKINKANAKYTDSLFKARTEHTNSLRNEINKIQTNLYNARTESSKNQKTELESISNKINSMRDKNRKEIEKARNALNKWTSSERTRVDKEVAKLRGVKWKDPSKESNKYEKRVTARAKEILGSSTNKTKTVKSVGSNARRASSSAAKSTRK